MRSKLFLLALPLLSLSSAHAALTYVDATGGEGGNTVNASTLSATDWYIVNPSGGADNFLWDLRTTGPGAIGYNGTAFQLNLADGSLMIMTAVTGLSANTTYTDIRLYYIGNVSTATNRNWSLSASVESATTGFVTYLDNDGNALVDSSTDALGTSDASPATDTRYWVSLPDVTTDETGTFYVWVDASSVSSDRVVYDGIAYGEAIPEPSVVLMSGLAMAGIAFSRRRR
ncbi:PEP-CTERM sorting domain-containing protein [Luteolibacter pohnpeiensis]|nr:PEP-CTERM sorting domain-containing protein [Luteolibacter pohnpeiensis]